MQGELIIYEKESCRGGGKTRRRTPISNRPWGAWRPQKLNTTTLSNQQAGPKNQPENISIEDQARYRELEAIIKKNFPTFIEVNTRDGEYMRPFSPEKIRIHKEVVIALHAMTLHSLYRVAGVESMKEWLDTRPYVIPSDEVLEILLEVVDDSRLLLIAWNKAVKKAGTYYPTMKQLRSAAKVVNRCSPRWLKEGRAWQKAFQEGMANGDVIVNVDIIH